MKHWGISYSQLEGWHPWYICIKQQYYCMLNCISHVLLIQRVLQNMYIHTRFPISFVNQSKLYVGLDPSDHLQKVLMIVYFSCNLPCRIGWKTGDRRETRKKSPFLPVSISSVAAREIVRRSTFVLFLFPLHLSYLY